MPALAPATSAHVASMVGASPQDPKANRSEIEVMIAKDVVPHAELIACFREAVDFYGMDARACELPRYVKSIHVVEREGPYDRGVNLLRWRRGRELIELLVGL